MAILIVIIVTTIISILWAIGIDKMNKEHPDYNGDDFLS